ncbi:MAG: hypothetical protein JW915_01845 [Chitinispirillaceae bacterium]|nr:hypothetical protein [Chitinispirillaceae bacterium]
MVKDDYHVYTKYLFKYNTDESIANYDTSHSLSLKDRVFDTFEQRSLFNAFTYIKENGTVLDLPCGTGRITRLLFEKNFSVLCSDTQYYEETKQYQ